MEVERVEAGAEVASFLFVPDEGLACDRANEVAVRLAVGQKDRHKQVILTGVELAISH